MHPSFHFIFSSLIIVDVYNEHRKKNLRKNENLFRNVRLFELYLFNSSSSGIIKSPGIPFHIVTYPSLVNCSCKIQARKLKSCTILDIIKKTIFNDVSHADHQPERG